MRMMARAAPRIAIKKHDLHKKSTAADAIALRQRLTSQDFPVITGLEDITRADFRSIQDDLRFLIEPGFSDVYDNADNFVVTYHKDVYAKIRTSMCCGIIDKEFIGKSGKKIYFAFDYGH
jgi:hypothetical protein